MVEHPILGFRSWSRLQDSVLAPCLPAYISYLQSHGYARHTIGHYLSSVAHFSRWLTRKRIALESLDDRLRRDFLLMHLPRCNCPGRRKCALNFARAALGHLFGVLRAEQRIRPRLVSFSNAIAQELSRLDTYLDEVCGRALATREGCLRHVRDFLVYQFGSGCIDLNRVHPIHVLRFVVERSQGRAPATAGTIASSIRTYLRFRLFGGDHTEPLIAAVPKVAAWPLQRVPKGLTEDQLTQFLNAFDRRTASGRRGYAMARLLADLGLRLGEVVRLQLDDLNWHEGTLRIRGAKGKRVDVLPLPEQTGQALVDYLRFGRPKTTSRALFVRHRAPLDQPISPAVVQSAVKLAYARCGWPSTSMSTHLLRHTVASRMLRGGASLKDIADVLRHRSLDTTMIYATVDFNRLAAVITPWPGGRS
jgi:site-specific recombinase XerD